MYEKVLLLTRSLFLAVGLSNVNLWGQDFSLASRQADFKSFVHDFEDSYAYLGRPAKPWLTWEARYGPELDKADSQNAFDTILASALSELHDFHAEVRSRVPDKWLPVPTFADIWAEFHGSQAVVTAIRQGSDAERARIRVGDKVCAVGSLSLEEAIRERLTTAVDQQASRGPQWALLSVLAGRADDARVLTVISPDGNSRTMTLPVERRFDRPDGLLESKLLENSVGLIRFVKLTDETADELAKRPIGYDSGFTLLPGKYIMKILAGDAETGRIGTYETTFLIPNLNRENRQVAISSVVLSSQRIDLKGALYSVKEKDKESREAVNPLLENGLKLIPSVTRVFRKSQDLYVFLRSYEQDVTAVQPLVAFVSFYRDGIKTFESPAVEVKEGAANRLRTMPLRLSIPLTAIPPGKYDCQISVLNPVGNKSAFWRTPLVVIP